MGYQETIIDRLGKTLHGRLDDITHEPLPRRWVDLIRHLDEQERNRPGRHDPTTKQDSNAAQIDGEFEEHGASSKNTAVTLVSNSQPRKAALPSSRN